MSITAHFATASLANDSLLSQCADFIETMLHRYLKTESEKPTPPTPAELQPAVNTLWRLSTIRKNLSSKPSRNSPPANPADPVILSKSESSPTHTLTPTQAAQASSLSSALKPVNPSDSDPVIQSNNSSPAPTIREVFDSIELVEKEIRRVQREMKSRAAQSSPSPPAASPSKFRYPPPKRTSV